MKNTYFSPEDILFEAVKYNRIKKIRNLIKSGAVDVNCVRQGGNDNTPLHISIRSHNRAYSIKTIMVLLENGADINRKNGSGITPLYLAASFGRKASIQAMTRLDGVMAPDLDIIPDSGVNIVDNTINRGFPFVAMFLKNFSKK